MDIIKQQQRWDKVFVKRQKKSRKCLNCKQPFPSQHNGHRRCSSCTRKVLHNDDYLYHTD